MESGRNPYRVIKRNAASAISFLNMSHQRLGVGVGRVASLITELKRFKPCDLRMRKKKHTNPEMYAEFEILPLFKVIYNMAKF